MFYGYLLNKLTQKRLSSYQLAEKLSTTQKTAWFMLQRLRCLVENNFNNETFDGTTEIDETYYGGKEENKHKHKKFTKQKDIIIGIVNRDTKKVKSQKVASTKYYYNHKTINHSAKEYVRENIHTNTIEGFFSLLKRTINGTYHFVSSKHLNKYLSEINYRYNNKTSACSKFIDITQNLVGRLKYRELIG